MLLHDKKKEGNNTNYNPVFARIALLSLYISVCMYIFLPHTVYIQVSQIKQGSIKIGLCFACGIAITRTTGVSHHTLRKCTVHFMFNCNVLPVQNSVSYVEGSESTDFFRGQVTS